MLKNEEYQKHSDAFEVIISNIIDLIASKRKSLNKSFRTISKETGISIGLLSEIEKHNKVPKFETILYLATYLQIDLSYIFSQNIYAQKQSVEQIIENLKSKDDSNEETEKTNIDNKFETLNEILLYFHYTKPQIKQITDYIKYIDYIKYSKTDKQDIQNC